MDLKRIKNTNSQILIETAQKMGIKVELLEEEKLKLRLTKDEKTHIVTKKSFGINPSKAIHLTKNKKRVTELLTKHKIPTPQELEISSLSELKQAKLPPFPLVLKPSEGQKAHDVYVGILDQKILEQTAQLSFQKYNSLILQEYIPGQDTRFFVLNKKVIGIALRHPPTLIGDGKSTIEKLILKHNKRLLDERQKIGKRMQNRLLNWSRITWHIENQGLKMSTIITQGKELEVYPIANFQAGGTVETISFSTIHPSIIKLAKKIAHITDLKVCGIDMIIKDLIKPSKENAFFLEINSDPSLRLHEWPNKGKPQQVTDNLLNSIFS